MVTAEWSRRGDSNPRPAVYETAALPLSYTGARGEDRLPPDRVSSIGSGGRHAQSAVVRYRSLRRNSHSKLEMAATNHCATSRRSLDRSRPPSRRPPAGAASTSCLPSPRASGPRTARAPSPLASTGAATAGCPVPLVHPSLRALWGSRALDHPHYSSPHLAGSMRWNPRGARSHLPSTSARRARSVRTEIAP